MSDVVSPSTDFLPIQSLDIDAETKIGFDLYINLPLNQKYVLYRKKGSNVEAEKLEAFSQYNIKNFFIQKSDYHEFVKYVALRIKALVGTGDSVENKRMMTVAAKSILSSTFNENNPAITHALLSNLNDITQTIIESILETSGTYQKRTFQKFAELAQKGTHFQKHPVNVASLAVLMAFGIGYSSEKILSDLAMAALLHDIGLSKLSPQIIQKSHTPNMLTARDREALYDHPQWTVDILREKNMNLSPLAELIILQHHEEFNGFGYPKGIRGYNLNEFAQILRVADELDQMILAGYSSQGNLKLRLQELLDSLHKDKIIEPSLSFRIRNILIWDRIILRHLSGIS